MKKGILLFALSGLLVSCGAGEIASSSLSAPSESSTISADVEESSSQGTQTIKGDSSRTYLKNALETSLNKRGAEITISNGLLSETLREYEYKDNNFKKTNNKSTITISDGTIKAISNNRNSNDFKDLNLAVSVNNVNVVATDGTETSRTENQSGHFYLDDNVAYWDFLNQNGQRSEELFDATEEVATSLLEALDYDVSSFTLSDKAKVSIDDKEVTDLLDQLMPLTQNNTIIPSLVITFFNKLSGLNGVDFTYAGEKDANGNKSYKTTVKVTDAKSMYDAIYAMVNDLPDVVDTVLPDDYNIEDILEVIEETEPFFNHLSTFNLELVLDYTLYMFQGLKFNLTLGSDGSYLNSEDNSDYGPGSTETVLESLNFKGDAAFVFDNERSITFPDFTTYSEFTLPEKIETGEIE